ncbi:uncharacterized protein LOC121810754 [Salvia splendens]|uniref:uncharacterized protein LOC121810754 n=1 Tax=Salvia splendens TaxID=180675 RepID=UPI001C25C1CE|nr:uncharacterized protein LOC121810754 [Salvia splendens]
MANKEKLQDEGIVPLSMNCSQLISGMMPRKKRLEKRIEPIDIALQLTDHSIVKPTGIVEDVLVKVDKFIIPVDFIVLDMPEDKEVPILFGRPFLATGDVLHGTKDNSATFRINGEQVTINVDKVMMHPSDAKACFRVDVLDRCIFEKSCCLMQKEDSVFDEGSLEQDFCFPIQVDFKEGEEPPIGVWIGKFQRRMSRQRL